MSLHSKHGSWALMVLLKGIWLIRQPTYIYSDFTPSGVILFFLLFSFHRVLMSQFCVLRPLKPREFISLPESLNKRAEWTGLQPFIFPLTMLVVLVIILLKCNDYDAGWAIEFLRPVYPKN